MDRTNCCDVLWRVSSETFRHFGNWESVMKMATFVTCSGGGPDIQSYGSGLVHLQPGKQALRQAHDRHLGTHARGKPTHS